jgi:hypothetical protein
MWATFVNFQQKLKKVENPHSLVTLLPSDTRFRGLKTVKMRLNFE